MTMFATAILLFSLFTIGVGIAAFIFVSIDSPSKALIKAAPSSRLFPVVRLMSTDKLETVDKSGTIQHWTRQGD